MAKKKFYAVAVGKVPGIYTQWYGETGAEAQVRGVAGAIFKGFSTRAEAEAFYKENFGKKRKSVDGKKRSKNTKPAKPPTSYSDAVQAGKIVIYTDGGALNNPGPGGYGVVIAKGTGKKELSAGYRLTTNNRMELMACIVGLSHFEAQASMVLFSDSKYVINGITKGWAKKWQANNWMRTKKEPAINPDLWERLLALCERHDVTFCWVKGHAGIEGNERCDVLATRAAMGKDLRVDTAYESGLKSK